MQGLEWPSSLALLCGGSGPHIGRLPRSSRWKVRALFGYLTRGLSAGQALCTLHPPFRQVWQQTHPQPGGSGRIGQVEGEATPSSQSSIMGQKVSLRVGGALGSACFHWNFGASGRSHEPNGVPGVCATQHAGFHALFLPQFGGHPTPCAGFSGVVSCPRLCESRLRSPGFMLWGRRKSSALNHRWLGRRSCDALLLRQDT